MAELDLNRIQALVEEAIDQGAATVGEIHQAVAAAPFAALAEIDPLTASAEAAQEVTARSIGALYDTIRRVNEQVGILAERMLDQRRADPK